MPRKSRKTRKTGPMNTTSLQPRPAARPGLDGVTRKNPGAEGLRDRRYDRRPHKFPGRLGGR
ncbi:hypothetical protein SAMN05444714_2571 [Yoonia litorea]|uniref:Uncharacterized protein n=1 Tax=Yoonia litorea TaxID=1123755 RepID=A0A1I6MXM2_9RHOB|nr:hypothetical protein SAMN05444714_2571 [Yoonia litorea]